MQNRIETPRDVSDYDPEKAGALCHLCPLKNSRYVPGELGTTGEYDPKKLSRKPKLIIVGEGPGYTETVMRRPFRGRSGSLLDDALEEAGLSREDAYVSNSHLCQPTTDKDAEAAAECCAPRLHKELAAFDPKIPIVALGKAATVSILGAKSILLARGFVWTARSLENSIKSAQAAVRKVDNSAKATREQKQLLKRKLQILEGRHALAGRTVLPTVHPAFVLRSDVWNAIFTIDMNRIARWVRGELTHKKLKDNVRAVKKPELLRRPGDFYAGDLKKELTKAFSYLGPTVAVDIETTHDPPTYAEILCVGVSDGKFGVVIGPWSAKGHAAFLTKMLRGKTVVFHNGFGFDIIALERDGVSFDKCQIEDTLIAHHAFASHFPQKLDHVVSTFVDSSPWKVLHGRRGGEEKGLAPQDMPFTQLAEYNVQDVFLTVAAWNTMQADLDDERSVYEHDKELSLLCKAMTVNGIKVDIERKDLLERLMVRRIRDLRRKMRRLTKKPEFKPRNLNDVRHVLFTTLRAPLINVTEKGNVSTANSTLETLKVSPTRVGKFCKLLLKYRIVDKINGTYVKPVRVDAAERTHYAWRPFGTVSGRLAGRFQSNPRWSKALEDRPRELYIAPDGKCLVYFDVSQAESRGAAYLSDDPRFIDACKGDVHVGNALVLFPDAKERLERDPKGKNCPRHSDAGSANAACNCGKDYRDMAKTSGFAVCYGATADTILAKLRSSGMPAELEDAENMLNKLREGYHVYYKYWEDNLEFVRKNGYLRTAITGRIRWFGFFPKPEEIANCYDEETEALVRDRGWVKGFDLKVGDFLLVKNIETGKFTWEPIQRLKLFPHYAGPLYKFESSSFNAVTTPGHEWLVTDRKKHINRKATTEELSQGFGGLSIHRTGEYSGSAAKIYTDDFVRLVGWLLTDGSISKKRISIYQTKKSTTKQIDALMNRLGLQPDRRNVGRGGVTWHVCAGRPIVAQVFAMFPDRTLTREFVLSLTKDQLKLLMDTMMLGDGSDCGHKRFYCRDTGRKDVFQFLCTLNGIATTARWRGPARPKKQYVSISNRPKSKGIWIITLLRRTTAQVLVHKNRYGNNKKSVSQVEFLPAGKTRPVWCPVVRNTFFVVRRRDDVYISANTPIQSFIADVMNVRLIELCKMRLPDSVKLITQVHDACTFEVNQGQHAADLTGIIDEMWKKPVLVKKSIVCRKDCEIPLPIDLKPGFDKKTGQLKGPIMRYSEL